jgi:hypothetical protein
MDPYEHRVLPAGIEIHRLDEEAVDLRPFRALEPHLFGIGKMVLGIEIVIDAGELLDTVALAVAAEYLVVVDHRPVEVCEELVLRTGLDAHVISVPRLSLAADHGLDLPAAGGNAEEVDVGAVLSAEVDLLPVVRPEERADAAVEIGRQRYGLSARELDHRQLVPVRFVSRPAGRAVREVLSVG